MSRSSRKIRNLAFQAMLIAISIVLVAFIEVPILPYAPYLKYDPSDIPLMFLSIVFGPVSGGFSAIMVCYVQSFMLHGSSGVYGFIMNVFATTALCVVVGHITKKDRSKKNLKKSMIIGVLITTVIMVITNIFMLPIFLKDPNLKVIPILITAIIPFNIIKGIINGVALYTLYTQLENRNFLKNFNENL